MATDRWLGIAAPVAQVGTFTVTADDNTTTFQITINGKIVSVVGSGVSTTQTATNLKAQLIASTIPEFLEVTWTSSAAVITATAATPGKPFTATSSVSGGAGTIGNYSATTASSGPNDYSTAGNWSLAAVPVATNDVFIETPVSILYGLDQHTVALNSLTISPTFANQLGLPILAKGPLGVPVNTTFTDTVTGGTLNFNTTYYYRVTALDGIGETLASTETSKLTANDSNATHQVTVNWGAVNGATGYRIYGRTTGAEQLMATVGNVLTWTDNGSITPAGSLPTSNTTNSINYAEYRGTYLQVNSPTVTVNALSNLMRIDSGSATAVTLIVQKTGLTPTEANTDSLRWKGTNAANIVDVQSGSVGICRVAAEVATVATLDVSGGTVIAGTGLTLTTANVLAGSLTLLAGLTTLTQTAGTTTIFSGNITTINANGGTVTYSGVGTITTLNVSPIAIVSFTPDLRGRTVTNATIYVGGVVHDPANTVTWTNAPTRPIPFPGPSNP